MMLISGSYAIVMQWAIHTSPTDDMVCLSQGVIQTSTILHGGYSELFGCVQGVNTTVLGGKVSRGVFFTVLGGKLLR